MILKEDDFNLPCFLGKLKCNVTTSSSLIGDSFTKNTLSRVMWEVSTIMSVKRKAQTGDHDPSLSRRYNLLPKSHLLPFSHTFSGCYKFELTVKLVIILHVSKTCLVVCQQPLLVQSLKSKFSEG